MTDSLKWFVHCKFKDTKPPPLSFLSMLQATGGSLSSLEGGR